MKNKLSALAYYAAAAVLFLFYVLVLLSSTETNVSVEYQMFYIEDKLAYFLEDGGLKKYGVSEDFQYIPDGMYRNQGKGWGRITKNGTWTSGPKSYVYFYIDAESKSRPGYNLKICTAESVGKSVTVYVNAEKAGKDEAGEDGIYGIFIPADCLREGVNEIVLETDAGEMQEYLLVEAVALEKCVSTNSQLYSQIFHSTFEELSCVK